MGLIPKLILTREEADENRIRPKMRVPMFHEHDFFPNETMDHEIEDARLAHDQK